MVQPLNVVLNLLVARQQGVTDQQVQLRTALIGGMLPLTTGLVLTTVLARREAEANASSSSTQIPNSSTTVLPTLIQVPDVSNGEFEFEEAKKVLEEKGLQVQRQNVRGTEAAAEKVIKQLPIAGDSVPIGSIVTLHVSEDIAPVGLKLPSVIGLSLENAKTELEEFEVNAYAVLSNQQPEVVVMQNPDPGSFVASGTTVTLLISANAKTFAQANPSAVSGGSAPVAEAVSGRKPISEVS